jgi:hypothetical protein
VSLEITAFFSAFSFQAFMHSSTWISMS